MKKGGNKKITEGMALHEVAQWASDNDIKLKQIKNYGTSILEGLEVDGTKIWFPRKYRTVKEELDKDALKMMTLKEMVMYNGEIAFFLVPVGSTNR